jgi:outer membrane protein OmpA-like peptidoglycan-associated protein
MQNFRTGSKPVLFTLALTSAALLVGCSGTRVFAGSNAFSIVGTPPPPPPPPPKKEPPPPPPEPPKRVEVRDNKIEIKEKIQFEVAKATILPASFDLLKEIADVIKNKDLAIKKLSIEGHASAEGDPKANMKLSDERAKSVMKHLIDKEGVDAKVLTAKGFGITKPIGDNKTDEGREKNRRVEFVIVEQDLKMKKVEIDPKTGKEKVLEEKALPAKPPAPKDDKADEKKEEKKEAEKKKKEEKKEAEKKEAEKK